MTQKIRFVPSERMTKHEKMKQLVLQNRNKQAIIKVARMTAKVATVGTGNIDAQNNNVNMSNRNHQRLHQVEPNIAPVPVNQIFQRSQAVPTD